SLKGEASRAAAPAPMTANAGPLVGLLETRAPAADPSTVIIKSNPDGSEIEVDGKFMGSTPSTLQLSPGDHSVTVHEAGFKAWQRKIAISSGGIVTLNVTLEKDR